MNKLLDHKNAIIYGGGGGLGAGVARVFAREGATVFLAGRTRETLDAVASEITAQGGSAHCAVLDALDEQAVNTHLQAVVDRAGSIDISINLMVTSGSGAVLKPSPQFSMGGTGPADAAIECFLHYLAAEVGLRGVRVAGLWTAGVFHAELMAGLSMLNRGPTLQQLADTAAFLASDRGSGITGSIVNVSSGVSAH